MYIPLLRNHKHLVTIHDLLAIRTMLGQIPETQVGATGQIYQKLILRGLEKAENIVCDSTATKGDALRVLPTAAARNAPVLLLGLVTPMTRMPKSERRTILESLGIDPKVPYLLHVGGNQFYKNRLGLLKIYAALQQRLKDATPPLLLVGKPFTVSMQRYLSEHPAVASGVRELTGLDNSVLRALYSHATALLFPSLYEGFGLPIIEAQACGCPVLTSDRPPMTEVGGNAAVYLPPDMPEKAAEVIYTVLADNEKRLWMKEAGPLNVQERFTTERMIHDYRQLYQQIARESPV
jgi:glycosyltransferase involved in cell wall biosynthesis